VGACFLDPGSAASGGCHGKGNGRGVWTLPSHLPRRALCVVHCTACPSALCTTSAQGLLWRLLALLASARPAAAPVSPVSPPGARLCLTLPGSRARLSGSDLAGRGYSVLAARGCVEVFPRIRTGWRTTAHRSRPRASDDGDAARGWASPGQVGTGYLATPLERRARARRPLRERPRSRRPRSPAPVLPRPRRQAPRERERGSFRNSHRPSSEGTFRADAPGWTAIARWIEAQCPGDCAPPM